MIVKVAAVQAAPVYMDLKASLEKASKLISDAAKLGAQVVVFPETWLPGYPAWLDCCRDVALWDYAPVKKIFARLMENSVAIPSPAVDALSEMAREHHIVLNMSVNERVTEGAGRGTLYNTMLTFGADGALLNRHRKIMPTYTERLVWGKGDGASLKAVDKVAAKLVFYEHKSIRQPSSARTAARTKG